MISAVEERQKVVHYMMTRLPDKKTYRLMMVPENGRTIKTDRYFLPGKGHELDTFFVGGLPFHEIELPERR